MHQRKFMRTRKYAAGILIKDNHILLMYRLNNGNEYFTLPGGGQEEGETSKETALREVKEETTVVASINKLLYKIRWDTGNENYYFLCNYIGGEPTLPESSEEFHQMKNDLQVYKPHWHSIKDLSSILLYPLEIRDLLITHIQDGYPEVSLELSLIFGARKF